MQDLWSRSGKQIDLEYFENNFGSPHDDVTDGSDYGEDESDDYDDYGKQPSFVGKALHGPKFSQDDNGSVDTTSLRKSYEYVELKFNHLALHQRLASPKDPPYSLVE